MKNIFLSAVMLFCAIACNAQYTLEQTYTALKSSVITVNFSSHPTKYVVCDTGVNNVKLYNADYSIWKTITPPTFSGYKFASINLLSDHLFNSDDNLEMVATYYNPSASLQYKSIIINESGVQIFDLGDAYFAIALNVDGGTKLLSHTPHSAPTPHYSSKIYSLPGEMPCITCDPLRIGGEQKQKAFVSQPIPNPAAGTMQITYALPAGSGMATLTVYNTIGQAVMTYPISPAANSISIDNSRLPDGFYHYSITGDGFAPVTNSFVK